jgi:hypothetical protein
VSTDCTEPDFEGTRLAEILGDLPPAAAGEQPWTPEEIAGFRERFAAAMANPGPLRVLPSEHWQARAEAAEARLAAIAAHCRARMKGPGRSGISLSAASFILGIAEGSEEADRA